MWLSNVFADQSDVARLIAVLVTGAFAMLGLFLNQRFNVAKARKELLVKKIEEAYQSAMAYERSAKALLKHLHNLERDKHGYLNPDQSLIDAMNEEVEKLAMLFGLYFPAEGFEREGFYAGPTLPVLEVIVKEKSISEIESIIITHATSDNICNNAATLKSLCESLMKKHGR